ncbi:muscle-specific protein 300 kDa-like isoform X2 [Uranotaenia lowii]|uniref:muscle-specific protein 300 kDa-like isoform X2 n=1 Tax=Uranotaenia lowii TaxID=190385 RepID=UPI00247A5F01|nr:muscle-specific protein 300 kDa-like isoform X2 [Uranotaenia lowii]
MYQSYNEYNNQLDQIFINCEDRDMLKLWKQYLMFVEPFILGDLPSDYDELLRTENILIMVCHLLDDLKRSLQKQTQIEPSLAELYNALNEQHSNNLERIQKKLSATRECLLQWEKYKAAKSHLDRLLLDIENTRNTLKLEYINLRKICMLINKISHLSSKFSEIETSQRDLRREMKQLISRCNGENVICQLESDENSASKKIIKLGESIDNWYKFLTAVSELNIRFEQRFEEIFQSLVELDESLKCITDENMSVSQHHLNMLKNEQLRLDSIQVSLFGVLKDRNELKNCISSFDARLIEKRMKNLVDFYDKMKYTITTLLNKLDTRMQNQKMFVQCCSANIAWIDDFEKRINNSSRLQSCEDNAGFIKTMEEMIEQQISFRECEIIWLKHVGEELLSGMDESAENNEIAAQLALLNYKWSNLMRLCKERSQKVSEINMTIISLQQRISQIKLWIEQIEAQLKEPFVINNMEKTNLDCLLDDYEKLQRSIEQNSCNIAEVLNLHEILFTDVESWNVYINRKHIHHDMNDIEQRWKNICLETSKRKQNLLSLWNMLLEVHKITDSYHSWVKQTDEYLCGLETNSSNIHIEQTIEILDYLDSQIRQIDSLESVQQTFRKIYIELFRNECIDRKNIVALLMIPKTTLITWESLYSRAMKIKTDLESLRNTYMAFITEYENIILALTDIDVQVTNMKHLKNQNEETSEKKLKRLQQLHNEFYSILDMFEKQDVRGSNLLQMISNENVESYSVQQKMEEYHQFANSIKSNLDVLLEEASQCCSATEINEKDFGAQVNTLPALCITAKDAYYYQLETALTEARDHLSHLQRYVEEINSNNFMTSVHQISKASAGCESTIELVKHLHGLLKSEHKVSDEDPICKDVEVACEQYRKLVLEWQTKQQKLEELSNDDYLTCPLCTKRNWQQIDIDLWRLEQWILMAEASQKSQPSSPPTDIDSLEDAIQDHREFLLDLDSHKSIIKSLNIVGEHLAIHTRDTEKALKLRNRLQEDTQRWDKVCQQASVWQSQLSQSLMENKEFHRTVTELCLWLENTEQKIKKSESIDLTSDKTIIEKKYKIFWELRADLMRCEPRIVSLHETTSQLTKCLETNKLQKFDEIYAKLTDLRMRFQSMRKLVEMYTIKIRTAIDAGLDLDGVVDEQECLQDDSGSHIQVSAHEYNANAPGSPEDDNINTTVLTRSYRLLGRVLRASLPIQAMLLLLLGVATFIPHGEDYSCSLTNNFARSLEPMLRYPNGPPPI